MQNAPQRMNRSRTRTPTRAKSVQGCSHLFAACSYGHALKDATLTERLIDADLSKAILEVVERVR
jgi:hypothetical protein